MKFNFWYIITVLLLTLYSCDKEDALEPSNVDEDWFIMQDEPDNAIKHRCYEIYKKWGIPVYCNDTIGVFNRVDNFGNPYTEYRKLQVFYGATTYPQGHFSLFPEEKESEILAMLDIIDNKIMPKIMKEMQITSLLLVDSLQVRGDNQPAKPQYRGFNTWLVGGIHQPLEMTEEDKEQYSIDVFVDMVKAKASFKEFDKIIERFGTRYSPTSDYLYFYSFGGGQTAFPALINVAEIFAGVRLESGSYPDPITKITDLDYLNMPEGTCLETFGYLFPLKENMPSPEEPKYLWPIPTKVQDMDAYFKALFSYSPDEFRAAYAKYPVCIEKYEAMKKIFEDFGFKF